MKLVNVNSMATTYPEWEQLADEAVAKGYIRIKNSIKAPDSGVLVGAWDCVQGGGWVSYSEVTS